MTPPTIISAVPKDCGTVLLEWSPATTSGVAEYSIAVNGQANFRRVIGTKTKAAVVDLPGNSAASFSVTAKDVNGIDSPPSAPVTVTLPAPVASAYSFPGSSKAIYHSQAMYGSRRVVYCGVSLAVIDGATVSNLPLPDLATLFGIDPIFLPFGQLCSLAMPALDTVILVWKIANQIRYVEFQIGAALTVVGVHVYGNSQSWPGDCLALEGGSFIGVHTQSYETTNPTPWFCVYRSSAGIWSVLSVGNSGLNFLVASNVSLVQHPADKTIWIITSADASGTIVANRLRDTGSGLASIDGAQLLIPNSGYYPWPNGEDPWVVARPNPSRGNIVVAYTRGDGSSFYSTKVNLNTPYAGFQSGGIGTETPLELLDQVLAAQVAFCEITVQGRLPYAFSLDGKSFLPQLPDRFERISSFGDFYFQGNDLVLVECPVNLTDLTRTKVFSRILSNGAWSSPVELGVKAVQDQGTVSVLAGQASFGTTDGTCRLAAIAGSVPTPTPVPTPIPVPSPIQIPLAPSNLTVSSATLRWQDNSNVETGFIIEYNKIQGNAPWKEAARVPAGSTSWGSIQSGRRYRVRAFNSVGISAPSSAVTA